MFERPVVGASASGRRALAGSGASDRQVHRTRRERAVGESSSKRRR